MSKSQEKKNKRILEHAEYLWEKAQLKAAMAQSQLGGATQIYKNLKEELSKDEQEATNREIAARHKDIQEYLETERDKYLARLATIAETNPDK